MTTAVAAPPTPTIADLVLVRMALPSNTPKVVREAIGKLCESGLSETRFNEIRDELAAAGLLNKGKRNTYTVSDAGREEVLRILGISEMPAKMNWSQVLAKYLLPKATNLSPEAASKLKSADSLAAFLLKEHYGLDPAVCGTVDKVMEAIVCRKLGYPEESTLTGLLEAVLNKIVKAKNPLSRAELKKQLPLYKTGLTGSPLKVDEIRQQLVREWLGRRKSPEPQQSEAFDLPVFASTVLALARSSPPADRFHENKVFISAVWKASQREPNFPRLSLSEFKQQLLEANAKGLLHLSRADMVQVMDPTLVAESETQFLTATFHFVLLEGGVA